MEIDNQTNDPIDYEQSGTGPDVEEECPLRGHLDPGQGTGPFPPCGDPPFEVLLKCLGAGPDWTVSTITSPGARITARDDDDRYTLALDE